MPKTKTVALTDDQLGYVFDALMEAVDQPFENDDGSPNDEEQDIREIMRIVQTAREAG